MTKRILQIITLALVVSAIIQTISPNEGLIIGISQARAIGDSPGI